MFNYAETIRTEIVNLSFGIFLIFFFMVTCLRYAQNHWEHKLLHYQVFHKK